MDKKIHRGSLKTRSIHYLVLCMVLLLLPQVASASWFSHLFEKKDSAPTQTVDISKIPNPVPKPEPKSRYGNPETYEVNGKTYSVLDSSEGYDKRGYASWYGTKFHGHRTSSGEPYDMYAMTAASKTLPLPTYVRVKNLQNGRSIIVKVNDRGPFHSNRIIDLSYVAAKKLGVVKHGTALVEVTAIDTRTAIKHGTINPNNQPPEKAKFYLQIGAFSNRSNAQRLANKLRTLIGAPVKLRPGRHQAVPIYRVQIGPFLNDGATARVASVIESSGAGMPYQVIE